MALMERGRSGAEKTRHIAIRYFWLKERVTAGEALIKHKGTVELYANFLTKPLQGSQFLSGRDALTGWSNTILASSVSFYCMPEITNALCPRGVLEVPSNRTHTH